MSRLFAISPVRLELLDVPPLQDEHRNQPGFYVAASSYDQVLGWRGAILYSSTDDGETWERGPDIVRQAVMGAVVAADSTTLNVTPGGTTDRANTVRVKIRNALTPIYSVTEEEMIRGKNRFLIGGEILGAANVALVSTDAVTGERTYDLKPPLLRGLKDTDDEIGSMVVGDRVVWLDGPGVQFVPTSYATAEGTRLYRPVPHGGSLATTTTHQFQTTGRTVRPFAVSDVAATRNGSNDVTFSWSRQTRAEMQYLDQGEPIDEEAETYLVECMDKATGLIVKREFTPTATTQTYTAAQQTTDGYTPGDSINVQVRQTSKSLHHGRVRAEFI